MPCANLVSSLFLLEKFNCLGPCLFLDLFFNVCFLVSFCWFNLVFPGKDH